ncbi:Histone deacetylase 8 [Coemansia sp. RSA 1933]|nr:Histone deacetylase 8 [Coemansia sp. RSA 1933]
MSSIATQKTHGAVVLVRSAQSIRAADALPSNIGRSSRVHALIDAFGLDNSVEIVEPKPLTDADLTTYHSSEYIRCLLSQSSSGSGSDEEGSCCSSSGSQDNSDSPDSEAVLARHGLMYDCPLFDQIEDHVRYVAGGTVAAANALSRGQARIAIHWEGGRHHAKRDKASGFCYVNDIVLGILHLQKQFARVLYIDLDLHHGDGVQDAFIYSDKVTTLSVHHYSRGFYPTTGGAGVEGKGRGAGHSINIPLCRGASDSSFLRAFSAMASHVCSSFAPQVVVVQCGCDGLAGDPYKVFNLTTDAFASALRLVISWELPVLMLGGGGYNNADCARCWTRLTAVACGADIAPEADVPEHAYLDEYAPAFDMCVEKMLVSDANTDFTVDALVREATSVQQKNTS